MAEYNPTFTPQELQNEIWKSVVGWERFYSVSNLGRVRREEGKTKGRIFKFRTNPDGYPVVTLTRTDGKKVSSQSRVHRLVAGAFIGTCPEKYDVNHKDGVKTNNRIENLEYLTRGDNHRHAFSIGLKTPKYGVKNGNSKLKPEDIPYIFELRARGFSAFKIATFVAVSGGQVGRILRGRYWRKGNDDAR